MHPTTVTLWNRRPFNYDAAIIPLCYSMEIHVVYYTVVPIRFVWFSKKSRCGDNIMGGNCTLTGRLAHCKGPLWHGMKWLFCVSLPGQDTYTFATNWRMSTRALETQYDQLVKKSCLNQVNISKVSNEIHAIIGKIENFEVENLKLQNVDIVNKSHCVEVLQSDVEYYTKLRDQQRRKNCAMRKAIKNLETKTFESLNDLTKQLSAYYTKTKPEQIQAIHENIRNTLSTENEQRRLNETNCIHTY